MPDGYVDNNRDCDDQNPLINPLALESHTDMIDNDCNGVIATTRPISNSVCHGYYEDQRDTTTRLQVIKLDHYPRDQSNLMIEQRIHIETGQPIWLALAAYKRIKWIILIQLSYTPRTLRVA